MPPGSALPDSAQRQRKRRRLASAAPPGYRRALSRIGGRVVEGARLESV